MVAVLLATFRESGIDFPTYHHIYDHIHAGGAYPIEWGWIVLNRVAPSYKAMLFLAALIFYGVSYIAIQRFDARYRWMSWLVILSTCTGFFYNGTRQAIASAFVFLGISYFYKKKYICFAVSVALGALFHKSAWIMLLLLPLYWFVMKRVKKLMLSTVIMSVIALFSVPIVVFAVRKMGIMIKLAVLLNSSKENVVTDVVCDMLGDSVIMKTIASGDASYEISQGMKIAEEYRKLFKKNLQLI